MLKSFVKKLALLSVGMTVSLSSCHDAPEYKDDIYGNFDALVDIVDSHYCFFEEKNINWRATAAKYRELIDDETNFVELFFICSALLDELEDGHVNLISRFDTSYYRKWWTDYPQDFNLRTVQENYLDFDWLTTSGIYYKQLPGEVAYMYYPSFSYMVGETSLDYILAILHNSRGLILDIRDNGGGALTNISTLVGRFITEKMIGGYIQHKTGPGHNDFSEPYPVEYKPAEKGRIMWEGPIVLLTNRSCFSAANDFTSVMKSLPNVTVVGAKTGGGGGLPFSSELPIGWGIRFSASPMYNSKMESIEAGIDPSEGFEVHAPEKELAEGKDAILDKAIDMLKDLPLPEGEEDDGEDHSEA
ncbi:MAG: S41 family peptidase [Bacteroides sp.]|nr:S41 family peptidase [Bacteroides sp.]